MKGLFKMIQKWIKIFKKDFSNGASMIPPILNSSTTAPHYDSTFVSATFALQNKYDWHHIFRNKRPERLTFRSNKKIFQNPSKPIGFVYSPLWKITHQSPSVLCTPPFENHPSKPIGFVYTPLWKITLQNPSVLCTPPCEKSLFLVGDYYGLGVYFGKYGILLWPTVLTSRQFNKSTSTSGH